MLSCLGLHGFEDSSFLWGQKIDSRIFSRRMLTIGSAYEYLAAVQQLEIPLLEAVT